MRCLWCEGEFIPTGAWEQKFCCDLHRNAWNRRRRRNEKYAEAVELREAELELRLETNGHERGTPEQRQAAKEWLSTFTEAPVAQPIVRRRI